MRKPPTRIKGAHASVRMYCQGFGDCLLVTLPREGMADFNMVIDCGLVQKAVRGKEVMQEVVRDLKEAVHHVIDVLVLTHEHYDHLSGFLLAEEEWEDKNLKIKEIWMAWTEDPSDPDAQALQQFKEDSLVLINKTVHRLGLDSDEAEHVRSLLEFQPQFASKVHTAQQLVVDLAPEAEIRFLEPGDVIRIEETEAQVVILGPPRSPAALKDMNGAKGDTFPLLQMGVTDLARSLGMDKESAGAYRESLRRALGLPLTDSYRISPFREAFHMPSPTMGAEDKLGLAKERWKRAGLGSMEVPRAYEEEGSTWRRIDRMGAEVIPGLALQVENMINNTSLVMAILLPDKNTILLPGDAQVGNWKSWPAGPFETEGKVRTLEDILRSTKVYKVGHHGSHNGTTIPGRFDQMPKNLVSLMPVGPSVWKSIPSLELVKALKEKGTLLASDLEGHQNKVGENIKAGAASKVTGRPLYYEVLLPKKKA